MLFTGKCPSCRQLLASLRFGCPIPPCALSFKVRYVVLRWPLPTKYSLIPTHLNCTFADEFQREQARSQYIRRGVMHLDSTGGTNRHNYTMTQLYGSTVHGFGVPLAYQISDAETVDAFKNFLREVKNATGAEFNPSCFYIDKVCEHSNHTTHDVVRRLQLALFLL